MVQRGAEKIQGELEPSLQLAMSDGSFQNCASES